MKLGLISDIHEHSGLLVQALEVLSKRNVDRVVVLGDIFETGSGLAETCRLLEEAHAIGVWGNHDFGLCLDPAPDTRHRYGSEVLSYMTRLQPRLVLEDCYFAHIEPWLNPRELLDLWYYEGMPETQTRRTQIFSAVPQRLIFAGHYHRWLISAEDRLLEWQGESAICLAGPERYFVVINALQNGAFAIYDTQTCLLEPLCALR